MPDDQTTCITNHAELMRAVHRKDRPFPCRRRGIHYATCEHPDTCRGCVPRDARHGYLCTPCYFRFKDALGRLAWLIAHLRSIEKPAQAIGERVHTSMERSILMPDTWIAADELMTALGSPQIPATATIDETIALAHELQAKWAHNLDTWINTPDGATQAVVLLRRMGTALKRWPDSEAELRHIPHVACPVCHRAHLWRRAPKHYGDELRVECGTEDCGYVLDWETWSAQYAPVFAALEADMKKRERAAASEGER